MIIMPRYLLHIQFRYIVRQNILYLFSDVNVNRNDTKYIVECVLMQHPGRVTRYNFDELELSKSSTRLLNLARRMLITLCKVNVFVLFSINHPYLL